MKKLLFSLLLSAIPFINNAQNAFAPVGAEWWHSFNAYNWSGGAGADVTYFTLHTESIKDTSINGVACRKVKTAADYMTESAWGPFPVYVKDFFFYDNTDTVFIYNENFNRFTPLYVFNAREGDTICLPVPPTPNGQADLRLNPISGDTSFCFVIDSVRIRLYDTSHLKTFYTHALTDIMQVQPASYPGYNWGPAVSYTNNPLKGQYIEHIVGDFIPTRIIRCVDCWSDTYIPFGKLRCYTDSFYHIKTDTVDCDFLPSLSIDDVPEMEAHIAVYPNPGRDNFSVQTLKPFVKDVHVVVTDICGRVVSTLMVPAGRQKAEIALDNVKPGLYFIRMSMGKGVVSAKIIVNK